jgi:hypothetical protein
VAIERRGERRATVRLRPLDRIPNKDFVLTWTTGGPAIESAAVAHKSGDA